MNHDASSSNDHINLNQLHAVESSPALDDGGQSHLRIQQAKRATFLDDLIRNMDIMIYSELSVLYYMDCSLFRLLLRAIPQGLYFTPKPTFFPSPPANRPYVATLTLTNLLVLFLHLYSAPPSASEAMRGYLHGGILMDFVGQQGPTSKLRLVLLDLLTMALQFLVLAVYMERRELKGVLQGRAPVRDGSAAESGGPAAGQDHDAEEQGVLRAEARVQDGIELLPLRSSTDRLRDSEADTDLFDSGTQAASSRAAASEHPLDTFSSGQHVIANLHVLETIRNTWSRRYVAAPVTGEASGSRSALGTITPARQRQLGGIIR